MFGLAFLTPRPNSEGKIIDIQMTCLRPEHCVDGRCTKQVSVRVAGGEDRARRMLKSWVVFGERARTRDRPGHRHLWDTIRELAAVEDGLPTSAELDAEATVAWPPLEAPQTK